MWVGWAQSRCSCGKGCAQSRCRRGGGVGPVPVQLWPHPQPQRCGRYATCGSRVAWPVDAVCCATGVRASGGTCGTSASASLPKHSETMLRTPCTAQSVGPHRTRASLRATRAAAAMKVCAHVQAQFVYGVRCVHAGRSGHLVPRPPPRLYGSVLHCCMSPVACRPSPVARRTCVCRMLRVA